MTRSVIEQSVVLPAPARRLYEMYLDPAAHAAFTGHPVLIGPEPGDAFRAFNGMLTGELLAVSPPQLIVQSWRSGHFNADDPDSTLILRFVDERGQGRIELIQLDVPPQDYDAVVEGWPKHYWNPWREWLETQ